MRSRSFPMLSVFALCVCAAAAAERSNQFSSNDVLIVVTGEPNDPNLPAGGPAPDPNQTWDTAAHLTATWESVSMSMTSQLYNPAVRPYQTTTGPQWSLALTSRIGVVDSNGLIGLSWTTGAAQAFDQDGREVARAPAPDSQSRFYVQPHYMSVLTGPEGAWVSEMSPSHFSVSLPAAPNAQYPSLLSRVTWCLNALVSNRVETVDVPFQPSDTWVELAPGLEILVEKAAVAGGKYEYTIQARWHAGQADYLSHGSLHLWHGEKPPAAIVIGMSILDAAGKPVQGSSGSFSSHGSYTVSGDPLGGTSSGTGNCTTCGNATTIRYTLAFNTYEKELWFTLENVPVPHF